MVYSPIVTSFARDMQSLYDFCFEREEQTAVYRLYLAGASPEILQALEAHGVHAPEVVLAASVEAALRMERDAAAG